MYIDKIMGTNLMIFQMRMHAMTHADTADEGAAFGGGGSSLSLEKCNVCQNSVSWLRTGVAL